MKRKVFLVLSTFLSFVLIHFDKRSHPSSGKKKRLFYKNYRPYVGIGHHTWNLRAMITEAYLSKRTLYVPLFRLAHHHNSNKKVISTLSEYYDYTRITVNGNPVEVVFLEPSSLWRFQNKHVPHTLSLINQKEDSIIKDLSRSSHVLYDNFSPIYNKKEVKFNSHKVIIPLSSKLETYTKRLTSTLEFEESAWIHVRRGDKLSKTAPYTNSKSIHKKIQEIAPETQMIYVATDERDLSLFDDLKKYYKVIFYTDIPTFKELEEEDNYKLFLVEQDIRSHFTKRIETFACDSQQVDGFLCPTGKHL